MSKNRPPIILASASPQRRKLLKMLDLPFTVVPSQAEELMTIRTTCAALVKYNALLKAHDVAAQRETGIVIGSDTVVYLGNKELLGKPGSLKDARESLRLLSARPRWVYTGVALVNAQTGEALADYERTKVFMTPLSDDEMRRYHKRVSPLDKAGGFDIEGWGSVFIPRIEGCYTNVIGLPLAKLTSMLKQFGVSVLSLLMLAGVGGCTSEFNLATQRQESYLYNTEKEVNVGSNVAIQIEKQYDVLEDVGAAQRADEILERIVAVGDRKDIVYFIKILDDEMINAVSLPGGYVYIFRGLYDEIETDDQLAGIIAHEVAHITAKHAVKRIQNAYGALVLQVLATASSAEMGGGVNLALTSLFTEYAQRDEFQADELGVKYMKAAGYDPQGMLEVLQILSDEQERAGPRPFSYWKTHPNLSARMSAANKAITGELQFKDYLNLMEYY